jgi:hypothetical protein
VWVDFVTEFDSIDEDPVTRTLSVTYRSVAFFDPKSPSIPSLSELAMFLQDAFTGDNIVGYLGMVQDLPFENVFSRSFLGYRSPSAQRSSSTAVPIIVAGSIAFILLASGLGVYQRSRRIEAGDDKTPDQIEEVETCPDFSSPGMCSEDARGIDSVMTDVVGGRDSSAIPKSRGGWRSAFSTGTASSEVLPFRDHNYLETSPVRKIERLDLRISNQMSFETHSSDKPVFNTILLTHGRGVEAANDEITCQRSSIGLLGQSPLIDLEKGINHHGSINKARTPSSKILRWKVRPLVVRDSRPADDDSQQLQDKGVSDQCINTPDHVDIENGSACHQVLQNQQVETSNDVETEIKTDELSRHSQNERQVFFGAETDIQQLQGKNPEIMVLEGGKLSEDSASESSSDSFSSLEEPASQFLGEDERIPSAAHYDEVSIHETSGQSANAPVDLSYHLSGDEKDVVRSKDPEANRKVNTVTTTSLMYHMHQRGVKRYPWRRRGKETGREKTKSESTRTDPKQRFGAGNGIKKLEISSDHRRGGHGTTEDESMFQQRVTLDDQIDVDEEVHVQSEKEKHGLRKAVLHVNFEEAEEETESAIQKRLLEEHEFEEKRQMMEARLMAEEESRSADEMRLQEERAALEERLREEKKARLAEEERREEERSAAEEARWKAEEESQNMEERGLEDERRLSEAREALEAHLKDEEALGIAEETRLQGERAALEERLRNEKEVRLAEEERLAEERLEAEEVRAQAEGEGQKIEERRLDERNHSEVREALEPRLREEEATNGADEIVKPEEHAQLILMNCLNMNREIEATLYYKKRDKSVDEPSGENEPWWLQQTQSSRDTMERSLASSSYDTSSDESDNTSSSEDEDHSLS